MDDPAEQTHSAIQREIDRLYPNDPPGLALSANRAAIASKAEEIVRLDIFWNPSGHWHYIAWSTLIEREEKQAPNPEINGWGFELTYRLEATAAERKGIENAVDQSRFAMTNAPTWPLTMLTDLVQRVWNTQRPYGHGHWVRWFLPRTQDPRGFVVLVNAPQLQPLATPFGQFRWLQVLSIDEETLPKLQADDFQHQLDEIAKTNARFVSPRALEPRLVDGRVA